MTEWLRDGLEGRSLKATLRLYLLGLMVLAPAAAVLALVFGGHASFVATPLLVLILVAVEYSLPYLPRLRKDFGELLWMVRPLIEYKDLRGLSMSLIRVLSPDSVNVGTKVGASTDLTKDEKTLEALVHKVLYEMDTSVRASVVAALEAIGEGHGVDRFIEALQDKETSVRYSAAVALAQINDRRAVAQLIIALGNEDESFRSECQPLLQTIVTADRPVSTLIRTKYRIGTLDEFVGTPLKDKDVSTPDEPVRKGA